MDKLLQMRCSQPNAKTFTKDEIYDCLFEKQGDKRCLENLVYRFLNLNKKMFDFLGIEIDQSAIDNKIALSFTTSNFIGAIPIKMPYDGLVHKDIQMTPRFDNNKDTYSELTQLLSCLEYSITPQYSDADYLYNPDQLKPPRYYEAIKYIELFEKASRYLWTKFNSKEKTHPYPKASTNWTKHAMASYDPKNTLIFPSHDSILTTNHKEWQELKYIFNLAKELVINPSIPGSIRFKYENRILCISNQVSNITPLPADKIVIRSSDPQCIKEVKIQANVLLKNSSTICTAWRMDMAELFERYVQYIVEHSTRGLSRTVLSNRKIFGRGWLPSWGLRYLEPDIMVKIENCLYMADAKYKANFYVPETRSDATKLKETYRADLHQLLAYCSFEPQQYKKTGILFYPAPETHFRNICYTDSIGGVCNNVILCGLAFGVEEMTKSTSIIKELFVQYSNN